MASEQQQQKKSIKTKVTVMSSVGNQEPSMILILVHKFLKPFFLKFESELSGYLGPAWNGVVSSLFVLKCPAQSTELKCYRGIPVN